MKSHHHRCIRCWEHKPARPCGTCKYMWFAWCQVHLPDLVSWCRKEQKMARNDGSHKQDQPDLQLNSRHLRDRRHRWDNQSRDQVAECRVSVQSSTFTNPREKVSLYHRVGRGTVMEIKNRPLTTVLSGKHLSIFSLGHKMKTREVKYFHNFMWSDIARTHSYMVYFFSFKMQKCK